MKVKLLALLFLVGCGNSQNATLDVASYQAMSIIDASVRGSVTLPPASREQLRQNLRATIKNACEQY